MKPSSSSAWRTGLGAVILAAQLGGIAYARFVPTRFIAWAPYDQIVFYRIEVETVAGRLSEEQVRDRYRIPKWGRSNRSWAHVTGVVSHYETTQGRDDGAAVRVRYIVNGRGPFVWRWPEQSPHEPGAEESAAER